MPGIPFLGCINDEHAEDTLLEVGGVLPGAGHKIRGFAQQAVLASTPPLVGINDIYTETISMIEIQMEMAVIENSCPNTCTQYADKKGRAFSALPRLFGNRMGFIFSTFS